MMLLNISTHSNSSGDGAPKSKSRIWNRSRQKSFDSSDDEESISVNLRDIGRRGEKEEQDTVVKSFWNHANSDSTPPPTGSSAPKLRRAKSQMVGANNKPSLGAHLTKAPSTRRVRRTGSLDMESPLSISRSIASMPAQRPGAPPICASPGGDRRTLMQRSVSSPRNDSSFWPGSMASRRASNASSIAEKGLQEENALLRQQVQILQETLREKDIQQTNDSLLELEGMVSMPQTPKTPKHRWSAETSIAREKDLQREAAAAKQKHADLQRTIELSMKLAESRAEIDQLKKKLSKAEGTIQKLADQVQKQNQEDKVSKRSQQETPPPKKSSHHHHHQKSSTPPKPSSAPRPRPRMQKSHSVRSWFGTLPTNLAGSSKNSGYQKEASSSPLSGNDSASGGTLSTTSEDSFRFPTL